MGITSYSLWDSVNENHPRLNYLLGIDAKENCQLDLAVCFYQKAIDNYPESDKYHLNEVYNNLGTALFEQSKYSEAKDAWEKGFILLPLDKMVLTNLFRFIYANPSVPEEIRKISPFVIKQLDRLLVR